MPHCPECGEEIDSVEDLDVDYEITSEDSFPEYGKGMYSCPSCGVILGAGPWSSNRGH